MIKAEGVVSNNIPYLQQGEELRLYLKPDDNIEKQPSMDSLVQVSRVAVIKGQGKWQFQNILGWQILKEENWFPVVVLAAVGAILLSRKR